MRLVSQNGKTDLPYEGTALLLVFENIIAYYNEKEYVMGKYSSERKAIKVMEMLKNTYLGYSTSRDGKGSIHNAFVLPKVFRFPKDEEVEK